VQRNDTNTPGGTIPSRVVGEGTSPDPKGPHTVRPRRKPFPSYYRGSGPFFDTDEALAEFIHKTLTEVEAVCREVRTDCVDPDEWKLEYGAELLDILRVLGNHVRKFEDHENGT